MITHDAQSSRSLGTEILLALDELQVMANRCHWIVSLIPPGTKTPAAIVLSQGQVVIRSADSPFTKDEVLLGGINDGALTFPDSIDVSSRNMSLAPRVEELRRYWGQVFSGDRPHEATILLIRGQLPMEQELRTWGVTAERIIDETVEDVELDVEFSLLLGAPMRPDDHYLSLVKEALLEYCGRPASVPTSYVDQTRLLIDWLGFHTEIGPDLEEVRRTLAL